MPIKATLNKKIHKRKTYQKKYEHLVIGILFVDKQ